jgi:transcriptional regulator with XRE-family HTH domain
MSVLGIQRTMHLKSKTAEVIRDYRLSNGHTQEEFGSSLGISGAQVGILEFPVAATNPLEQINQARKMLSTASEAIEKRMGELDKEIEVLTLKIETLKAEKETLKKEKENCELFVQA